MDDSGHTFEYLQSIWETPDFYPLRHLGTDITTLRLDRGTSLGRFEGELALYEYFRTLDAVQVFEFDGAIASVNHVLFSLLSDTGVLPGLKVIRVWVSRDDYPGTLLPLATALRLRAEGGNPLTAIEPLFAEGEDGLGRVEWEKHYEAEGIQNFLSKWYFSPG